MGLRLKNRKLLRLAAGLSLALNGAVAGFWVTRGDMWTGADWALLDFGYRRAVIEGKGPSLSPRIVYVLVTDASYEAFGKNALDRTDLARVTHALAELGTEAVGFDIIFARPSREAADRALSESFEHLGTAYLPVGFALSGHKAPFRWKPGESYERFRNETLFHPVERGEARPFYATRALMQEDGFAIRAMGSGHISAYSDPDGVYRRMPMLIRVNGAGYVPALTLSMFLDFVRVPPEEIAVEWGEHIVIPAIQGSFLEEDVVIPIDSRGRAIVPFAQPWNQGFPKMEAHALLSYAEDPDLRGNLLEHFEGNFVFLGDVAVGTADLGQTPLEGDVPLIALHTSLLNGMLTNTFFEPWSSLQVLFLLVGLGLVLCGASLFRASWVLYATGLLVLGGLGVLTWTEQIHFRLFPLAATGGSVLVIGFGLVAGLEWAVSRQRSFIKGAFSKYVPKEVVHQLLLHPERLSLGGEERVMTVLFSDLANFTSISERMPAPELVPFLNTYLTEMTDIVLEEGGIVDKYEGDAIMAEFGAPLDLPDHPDRAVRTGLRMQQRLAELRSEWREKGLPELHCRVGVNTGPMVVGNMGSGQVFDYTVIGDAVNLASRLEGANKHYRTELMISEFTREHLTPGRFHTRLLDVIRVKGKSEPVRVYEVLGEASEPLDTEYRAYAEVYEEAFKAYLGRDFEAARNGFEKALALRPDDPASRAVMDRMEGMDPHDLPEDWDGSISLLSK